MWFSFFLFCWTSSSEAPGFFLPDRHERNRPFVHWKFFPVPDKFPVEQEAISIHVGLEEKACLRGARTKGKEERTKGERREMSRESVSERELEGGSTILERTDVVSGLFF